MNAVASLQQIEVVLEGILEPAILLGPDYRILAANHAYQERYAPDQQVRGRLCFEVSHHGSRPCSEDGEPCPLRLVRDSGESQRVLHIHHTPNGEEHVEVEGRPVFDETGQFRYLVEIVRRSRMAATRPDSAGLVGCSREFLRMLSLVQRVAASETPVLLLGESGTGKELVAKAIHDQGRRASNSFVPVECSGLTESLFESELFGHEKGAFTGAQATKIGLVEAARGGTLFLDEIGDIPLTLQVKLLRLLETGTYRRVGSVEPRQADFRLICATHRDLAAMRDAGEFRQDLYYRISAFPIDLPPLRKRLDDLPLLSATLLQRIESEVPRVLSKEALAVLAGYDFPGNIRELRNLLERATLMSDGRVIHPRHLPGEINGRPRAQLPGDSLVTLAEAERRYLQQALSEFPGNRKALANKLGISERTLFRKLQRRRDH